MPEVQQAVTLWGDQPDLSLRYWCSALDSELADRCFRQLLDTVDWQQQNINLFGRQIPQPRLTAWFGDPDARYRYSGLQLEPQAWLDALLPLKQRAETLCETHFNSVLLNLYRDGRDYMGWHQDNEKELGDQPGIASFSLGAVRDFQLRHKATRGAPLTLQAAHGSLLLMSGRTQQAWQHRLRRQPAIMTPRINLTFRRILTA